jgi:signal transduction histidine kinase
MKFGDLPIRTKLLVLILLTSGTLLLITCAALVTYDWMTFRNTMARNISTMGQIIAVNSSAILIYDDKKVAEEILSGLRAEPDIEAGCLYDRTGRPYATYPTNLATSIIPARPDADGFRFTRTHAELFEPVMQGGKREGTLYIRSNLDSLVERLRVYGSFVLLIWIGAGAIALFVSNMLQHRIARPILELASTAKTVSDKRNFSLRADKKSNDEVGQLTEAFNQMLVQIGERDAALQDAHQKLHEHAQDLEKRVAERTAQLRGTISELESFSYSISHDMRAPLRAMQGYAHLLLEEYANRLEPQGREYLQRIARTSSRLDVLIQDVLCYGRISRDEMELQPVSLQKIVEDVLQQYPALHEADIVIQRPLPSVRAHEASLTQLISNLIDNAAKFVRPGEKPKIRIWTEKHEDRVRLFVEDHGIGIAEKDVNRIFDIFERVHDDKTYEGTGIGLSIVKKAAERMGGSVGLKSALNQGSVFWVELPDA